MKIVGWYDEGLLIKDALGYFFERLREKRKQISLENYVSEKEAERSLKQGEVTWENI